MGGDPITKKRIGLYGGTFNPVHFGHLNLAIELQEKCRLDEVWWIPTLVSPFRQEDPCENASHRFKMVSLAIAEIAGFRVLDNELHRPAPSYTIDTIREVVHEEGDFFLLLGEDALLFLKQWKEVEEIFKKVSLIVGCRQGANLKKKVNSLGLSPFASQKVLEGLVETTVMEISSTQIRNRLKSKLYCGHLVPAKVLDYIYENQLYFHS